MKRKFGRLSAVWLVVAVWIGWLAAEWNSVPAVDSMDVPMALVYLMGDGAGKRLQLLDRVTGRVDVVSPDFFYIRDDGSLSARVDPEFIREAHQRGMKVVPFVTNDWNAEAGRRALARREELAAQLSDWVGSYGLDGVIIDVENLSPPDRDDLTAFVQAVRSRLPLSKQLGAAVAAVQGPVTTGWESAYDDAALATLCDYLTVMTYDESYQGGEPGPVADLPWMEQSIRYMLTVIPRNKFLLGVPLFGRKWEDGSGGAAIPFPEVANLVETRGIVPQYDAVRQTMHLAYDQNGTRVDIYYDNRMTLTAKLGLVAKYGLRGGFAWRLGQEDPSLWDVFRGAMSGDPFLDISGSYARPEILQLWDKGIIKGEGDGCFYPDRPITRAETVTMLIGALQPSAAGAEPFVDVPPWHWAYGAVTRARAAGWVQGTGDGQFEPDRPITREEGAVMIAKAFGIPPAGSSRFPDMAGSWADGSVAALCDKGIVRGFPDGRFWPDRPMTRAEMAVVLARCLGIDNT